MKVTYSLQNTQLSHNILKGSEIEDTVTEILSDNEFKINDLVFLLKTHEIQRLGLIGNKIREDLYGKKVSFINNIILNYTNVCVTYCKFCAFYRPPGHKESYTVSKEEILNRIVFAKTNYDIKQVLFQGGHNPKLNTEYFEDVFNSIRTKCPDVAIHGLSASEIDMISRVDKSSPREVLSRLKHAGLESLPGAGAEILVDEVKEIISPLKISSQTWLDIMETAHDLGIKSSATMMYGTVESIEQRARHIIKIAELQKKTKGFMAFIPWSFEPNNTEINESGIVQFPMGGFELLKMISVSRIVFKGLIDHLQSSWLTNGIGMAQLAIYHGSDDFGGTLIGEEVVSATGARSTELLAQNIINAIKAMGYIPVERRNNYEVIKHF
ncbi:CofH family radical SAM protein [Candidatus Nitrosocosmicus agrestis]|jgi:cyclic dehypoxanthinyl futalosine synthase|uniref:CofH family radical SAM protein n=1 Tax=Candidatus Nitrosocosmicus agrestis TaxID=2563600 RepID=UPI00122E5702|nr:CofH family radical SAM protein [Candidatus Nitrosocosmicus sp. SS]KAA2280334.1 CofH family radical SAM protein [Candidatus Nitrosocosmicus sp. SS]KAF0867738.1 CofH family radical SAM protein [Candidatus Nitrosocosmicus sp. SS]